MKMTTILISATTLLGALAIPLSAGAAAGTADINARMNAIQGRMTEIQERVQNAQTSSQNVSGMASMNGVPMDFGGWTFSSVSSGNTHSYTFTVTNELRGPQF